MTQQSTQDKYPRDRFDDVERYTTQQGAHRQEFPVPKGAGQLNAIILAGGAALAIGIGSYLWLYPSDPLNQDGPEPEEVVSAPVDDEPQDADEDDEPEELDDPEPVEEPEDVEDPETVEVEELNETPEPDEPEEPTDLWLYPSDPLNQDGPEPEEVVSAPVDDEPQDADEDDEPEELDDPEPVEEPTDEGTETDDAVDYDLPVSVYNASTIQGHAAQVAQELGSAGFNVPVADSWNGQIPAQTTVFYSNNEATARAVADEVDAVPVHEASVEGVLVVLTAN